MTTMQVRSTALPPRAKVPERGVLMAEIFTILGVFDGDRDRERVKATAEVAEKRPQPEPKTACRTDGFVEPTLGIARAASWKPVRLSIPNLIVFCKTPKGLKLCNELK